MKTLPFLFTALVASSSYAVAQTADVFVMDKTQDQIIRLTDLDSDGLFYTKNEATSFAQSPSVEGAAMRFENGVAVAYWIDDNTDTIYRGVDSNYNGLIDPSEALAFRDSGTLDGGSNADAVVLTSDGGVWWAGRWDGGSSPMRGIHRMEDLNGDGDAEDAGELVTLVPDNGTITAPSTVAGMNVPVDTENFTRLTKYNDGVVAWTGFSGSFSNDFALYRFEDLNSDGDVLDAGEVSNFMNAVDKNPSLDRNADFASGVLRDLATVDSLGAPSGHARLMHLATLEEGGKQVVYAASDSSDTGNFSMNANGEGVNGLIYRCEDLNLDGDANDAGEVKLFFDGSSTSPIFNFPKIVGMAAHGDTVYVASLNNDTVVFGLKDLNGDGDAMDLGEQIDNFGSGIWDPNTYGNAHGDYPVLFDVDFSNYHVFSVNIAAFDAGAFVDPSPTFTVSGVACSNYSSDLPTIHGSGVPEPGSSTFTVSMRNVPGGQISALAVGTSTAFWNGIPLPLDLSGLGWTGCFLYQSWNYTFYGTTGAGGPTDGVASRTLTIPSLPSLVGFNLPMQYACIVPDAFGGFDIGVTALGTVTIE